MEGEAGGWLWLLINVLLVAVLGAGLIYGVMMWRRRRRDARTERMRDEATREAYREPTPD